MKKHISTILTTAILFSMMPGEWAGTAEAEETDSSASAPKVSMSSEASEPLSSARSDRADTAVDRIRREARTLRQEADKLRRMARRLEDDSEDLEERAQELLAQMREFQNSLGEFNRISGQEGGVSTTRQDSTPAAIYETYLAKQELLMTNMRAIADGLQTKALEMASKVREMKEMADAKESAATGLEQKTGPRD